MPKRILVIDADRAFARDLSAALQARGAETRLCVDGQHGVEEARSWIPDLVVLCVELPGLSGYSVCNKLKKDEQLRAIPLVLTSAEATAETFEQHRKLRTRADEYLLKPLSPNELVRAIARKIELPPEAPRASAFEGLGDDDLKLIDRVFDELASAPEPGPDPLAAPAERAPITVVGRLDRSATADAQSEAIDPERLAARVAELESALSRAREELATAQAERARRTELEQALQQAAESERLAGARAAAAESRVAALEVRVRQADALREKARRALAVLLQAFEDPAQRSPPAEVVPRRE